MAANLSDVRASAMAGQSDPSPLSALLVGDYRSNFDPQAWHAMQERDNQLIRDEIMHGFASLAFIYSFDINGKKVHGISVIGARELASQYKGIKARIVATVEKKGALFIFRTFTPLNIETRVLNELANDDDYYECVMEISDLKTGNSIEVRKKENRFERKRDGTPYGRPHYDVICESKAYRNGVLAILPQGVIKDFEARCLASGGASSEQTIDQLRAGVIAFAAKHGLPVDRREVNSMAFAEIIGLGNAAKAGKDAFVESAASLGIIGGNAPAAAAQNAPAPDKRPAAPVEAVTQSKPAAAAAQTQEADKPKEQWHPTAEEEEAISKIEQAEAAQAAAPSNRPRRPRSDAGTME